MSHFTRRPGPWCLALMLLAAGACDDPAGVLGVPSPPNPSAAPAAPADLTPRVESSNAIVLGWIDRSRDESAFLVDREVVGAGHGFVRSAALGPDVGSGSVRIGDRVGHARRVGSLRGGRRGALGEL